MNPFILNALLITACAAPAATAAETAEAVAARVRSALGLDTLRQRHALVNMEGDCRFLSVDAACRLVFDGAGRMAWDVQSRLGLITGVDGRSAWEKRLGYGRALEFEDLDRALLFAAATAGTWTLPAAAFQLGAVSQTADGAALDVAFTSPTGAVSGVIAVDRATWLPQALRWTSADTENSITIEKYADHGAGKAPAIFTMTSSQGGEQTFRLRPADPARPEAAALIKLRIGRPNDTAFDPAIPAELEVRRAPTGHLLVHPLLDGQDVGWFIFDTGAGVHCLTPEAGSKLGLKEFGRITVGGAGGHTHSGFYDASTLALGPFTTAAPQFVSLDLGPIASVMGVEIAGVIGFDLFSRAVVVIDMDAGTIALHDPSRYTLPHGAKWEELLLSGRHPCVHARFEGHEGVFKLDTGAAGTSLIIHESAVDRLNLLAGRETHPARLGGVGGFVNAQAGTLEFFELAGKRFDRCAANFQTERKGAGGDPYTTGNIGGLIIGAFTLILDYGGDRIALVEKK